jgi:hypothetical protein
MRYPTAAMSSPGDACQHRGPRQPACRPDASRAAERRARWTAVEVSSTNPTAPADGTRRLRITLGLRSHGCPTSTGGPFGPTVATTEAWLQVALPCDRQSSGVGAVRSEPSTRRTTWALSSHHSSNQPHGSARSERTGWTWRATEAHVSALHGLRRHIEIDF